MAAHDLEKRRAVAAAGGHGRKEKADPATLTASGRAGAAAANAPATLARRIAKRWPDMTREERAEVRAILRPLLR